MKQTIYQRILEVLKENPGVSVKELAVMLGLNANRIRTLTYKLRSLGYIEKAGRGFVITEQGLRFLEYISKKATTSSDIASETRTEEHTKPPVEFEHTTQLANKSTLPDTNSIIEKLREIERRLVALETKMKNLEKAFSTITRRKPEANYVLETPVMYYNDATSKHGPVIDKMVGDGKLVKIGSLVVDTCFYASFKSKFPIRVVDVDKLTPHEKLLLEEMRKEALVVLYAGKEYRLVE